jgi:hypothetical protein
MNNWGKKALQNMVENLGSAAKHAFQEQKRIQALRKRERNGAGAGSVDSSGVSESGFETAIDVSASAPNNVFGPVSWTTTRSHKYTMPFLVKSSFIRYDSGEEFGKTRGADDTTASGNPEKVSYLEFATAAVAALRKVGFWDGKNDVSRFLNRLLGIKLELHEKIFEHFLDT